VGWGGGGVGEAAKHRIKEMRSSGCLEEGESASFHPYPSFNGTPTPLLTVPESGPGASNIQHPWMRLC
jgi:hypothetical protein